MTLSCSLLHLPAGMGSREAGGSPPHERIYGPPAESGAELTLEAVGSMPWLGAGRGRDVGLPLQPHTTACPDPWSGSVNNRGQEDPPRLVVEPQAHERQGLDHAEAVRQTPAEQLPIPRRQQKAWSHERRGGPDQGLEIGVTLAHGMAREPDHGGIAGETALVLDHGRGAVPDGLQQFTTPIMAVDAMTQGVAVGEIRLGGPAHRMARDLHGQRWPLQGDERLADLEPERRIQ